MNNNLVIQPGIVPTPGINNTGNDIIPTGTVLDLSKSEAEVALFSKMSNITNCNFIEEFRTRTLYDVIGNEDAIEILSKALKYNFHHNVYFFEGPPGTAKTSTATTYARSINCEDPIAIGVPCEKCNSCTSSAVKANPDIVEINAGSDNGVDKARQIKEATGTKPLYKKKVFILDEWHRMTKEALTALLTVMEAPTVSTATAKNSDYIFILISTEPATGYHERATKSRGITLHFYPAAKTSMINYLERICEMKEISVEEGALDLIYNYSNGGMRDCLKNLQALAIRCELNITVELTNSFFSGGRSALSKELFDTIHTLDPGKVSSLIESHCNQAPLKEVDFNELSDMFIQCCNDNTSFMQDLYTSCLSIIRDNRITFLKDPSRKAQENLIVACNKIITILKNNLAKGIANRFKEYDPDFGDLLLSLNPNITVANEGLIFTMDPPTLGLPGLVQKILNPDNIQVFRSFLIFDYKFNNIGRNVCIKASTIFDRNFAEQLISLNPITYVDNGKLILSLNQPAMDNYDFMNKISSAEMLSILDGFGISEYVFNGANTIQTPNNVNIANNTATVANNSVNNINTNNTMVNNMNIPNNHDTILSICDEIGEKVDGNFGAFLKTLNPELLPVNQDEFVFLINPPTHLPDGTPLERAFFEGFLYDTRSIEIFKNHKVVNCNYRQ